MQLNATEISLTEIDLRIAGSDWLGQGPTIVSGPAEAKLAQVSFLKVDKPFGRFGNNYYQAMHAVVIANALGIERVIIPPFLAAEAFAHDCELKLSVGLHSSKMLSSEFGLSGAFYVPYGFESVFTTQSTAHLSQVLRLATDQMYPTCVAFTRSNVLAIHIRAGDIFAEGSKANWYVQPHASFYTKAIKHALANYVYDRCELVYEDRGNPAVDIVESYLESTKISFTSESNNILNDISRLTSAHGLICSFSSFVEASALISRCVRAVYVFRSVSSQIDFAPFLQTRLTGIFLHRDISIHVVEDMSVNFIAPKTWSNSVEQRATILDYPENQLRLFSLTKQSAC